MRAEFAYADDRKRKADHFRAVIRCENLAASMVRDDEDAVGDGDFFAPRGVFDAHAFVVIRNGVAMADRDLWRGRWVRHGPREGLGYGRIALAGRGCRVRSRAAARRAHSRQKTRPHYGSAAT